LRRQRPLVRLQPAYHVADVAQREDVVVYAEPETWAGPTSTRSRRSATTSEPRAARRGWSWSARSRTGSRSPTRPDPGDARRRRLRAATPQLISDFARGVLRDGGRSGRPSRQRGARDASSPRAGRGTPQAGAAPSQGCAARGASYGTPRGGTARAAAPAAGRVNRRAARSAARACGSSCGCGETGIRTGLRSRRSRGHEGSTPSIRTSSRSQPKGDPDARAARRGGVSRRASSGPVRASVTATRPGPPLAE
jgi:hypothetical protein